MYAELRMVEAM